MNDGLSSSSNTESYNWLPMCTDGGNYIVQSNDMVTAKQGLNASAAKIVRLAIMQIKPSDASLSDGYFISVQSLSEVLGVPTQNLYRDLDRVTDEIMSSFVEFRQEDRTGNDGSYTKIAWASRCHYVKKKGLFIKLNPELSPYLVGLKKLYTQYQFVEISKMKSIYAIRLYELIMSKLNGLVFPKEGRNVVILINEILEMCSCMYKKVSDIKNYVMDIAVRDINRCTLFDVEYSDIKEGRSIVGFNIKIVKNNIKGLYLFKTEQEEKREKERKELERKNKAKSK